MTCSLAELTKAVALLAPPGLAEDWDNVGLQAGDPNQRLERVMTCLEVTPATLNEAVERGAQAIVAHHPLIFKPLTALNEAQPTGALLARLVRERIGLVAAHTNLDAAAWGTNQVLGEKLGLTSERPLLARGEMPAAGGGNDAAPVAVGLGCVAALPEPMTAGQVADWIRQRLGMTRVRFSGNPAKRVRRLAWCTGAGGSYIGRAAVVADAYLTGEINYHHGIEAHQRGLPVIEIGHYESEVIVAGPLAEKLAASPLLADKNFAIFAAECDLQPFRQIDGSPDDSR